MTGLSPTVTQNPTQIGPNVARYVDVIHTNTAGHGNINSLGRATYFPNGGLGQPWCDDDACSHDVAMTLWAESVLPNIESWFYSLSCQTWEQFCRGDCNHNQVSSMGFHSIDSWGPYFLQTNHIFPFSRFETYPNC